MLDVDTTESGAEPLSKLTERDMFDMLHRHYGQLHGNGQRWVRAEQVRSRAGIDAPRTADFMAMDLWPSQGLALHGHEVKVSRADWLVERKHPEKAGQFLPYMTYWWLVIAHHNIINPTELPDGWGLLLPDRNGQLQTAVPARRRDPAELPRTLVAALLRAAVKTAASSAPPTTTEPLEGTPT